MITFRPFCSGDSSPAAAFRAFVKTSSIFATSSTSGMREELPDSRRRRPNSFSNITRSPVESGALVSTIRDHHSEHTYHNSS
jgi:hypothetical protein